MAINNSRLNLDVKIPDEHQQFAIDLALKGESFFVSGKAGTGKTFVLECIVQQMEAKGKSVAVTAPTGVAAHNAGGKTIHSFFGLPQYTYSPGKGVVCRLKTSDREVIKALDVLIIDEISMVRCDLLDMVDKVLRQIRDIDKPFGGLQFIFFGDLFQLPPVVKSYDKQKLNDYYDLETKKIEDKRYYFFKSKVIEKIGIRLFELEGNHRQKDDGDFYNLLNDVRERKNLRNTLAKLNKRVLKSQPKDSSVQLHTHRDNADTENQKRLSELSSKPKKYEAEISSDYTDDYPTDGILELKKNAKVMILKNNDTFGYYNGSQGVVTELNSKTVTVRLEDGRSVEVGKETWQQRDLIYDSHKERLIQNPFAPTFTQIPLRLSWAITVHKSQGMTFDSAVVQVERAFDHGHVYVALSRCKSLKGLILKAPLTEDIIIVDETVVSFMKKAQRITLHNNASSTAKINTTTSKRNLFIPNKNNLTDTLSKTFGYINAGQGITAIATLRGLTVRTIESHVASLIEMGYVAVEDYVDYNTRERILASIKRLGSDASASAIMTDCKGYVSYADINMVRASLSTDAIGHSKAKMPTSSSHKTKITDTVHPKLDKNKKSSEEKDASFYLSELEVLRKERDAEREIEEKRDREFMAKFFEIFGMIPNKDEECKEDGRKKQLKLKEEEERQRQEEERRKEEARKKLLKLKEEQERQKQEEERKKKEEEERKQKAYAERALKDQRIYNPSEVMEYNNDKTIVVACPQEGLGIINVPSGVQKIARKAFAGCEYITDVIIPSSTWYIGDYAFEDCKSILRLIIPKTVKEIGASVFDGYIKVENGNTKYSSYDGALLSFDGCKLFSVPKAIERFHIPNTVEVICESSFQSCKKLTKLILPNSIKRIEDFAFYSCSAMSSITIPADVDYIGGLAFGYCSSLNNIRMGINNPKSVVKSNAFVGLGKNITMHVPPGCSDNYRAHPAFSHTTILEDYIVFQDIHVEKKKEPVPQQTESKVDVTIQQQAKWTEEEDQILMECQNEGESIENIALLLDCDEKEVEARLEFLRRASNYEPDKQKTVNPENVNSTNNKVSEKELNDSISEAIKYLLSNDKSSKKSATGKKTHNNETLWGNFIIKRKK